MKSRIQDAVNMFESGFNCAQSVFVTYADIFGMDRQTALKLAGPMGAGVGRMREVCGTVSAMAMLSGLKMGNTDPADEECSGKKVRSLLQERRNIMHPGPAAIWLRKRPGLWKKCFLKWKNKVI